MSSINISLKKEAYDFLRSLKTEEKSFSDVILEFKEKKGNKENVMRLFGTGRAINIDWKVKEKKMKAFREDFDKIPGLKVIGY